MVAQDDFLHTSATNPVQTRFGVNFRAIVTGEVKIVTEQRSFGKADLRISCASTLFPRVESLRGLRNIKNIGAGGAFEHALPSWPTAARSAVQRDQPPP